jgi:gluconate 5-dehydrogenase
MKDLFDLSGKKALVTGGNRGIGFAIANEMARFGADVAIVARTEDQLTSAAEKIRSTGRKVYFYPFDLMQTEDIPALFEKVSKDAGGIDILVNNAGRIIRSDITKLSLEDFRKTFVLDIDAVFMLSREFAKRLIGQGKGGKIINIGSLNCELVRPTISAYAAAKGAIRQFTRACAVEWAPHGINVNAIAPGYIATELTKPLADDEEFTAYVKKSTPLGRWGRPEDLVGLAILLASKGGDFITGQTIYVDGGWLVRL